MARAERAGLPERLLRRDPKRRIWIEGSTGNDNRALVRLGCGLAVLTFVADARGVRIGARPVLRLWLGGRRLPSIGLFKDVLGEKGSCRDEVERDGEEAVDGVDRSGRVEKRGNEGDVGDENQVRACTDPAAEVSARTPQTSPAERLLTDLGSLSECRRYPPPRR